MSADAPPFRDRADAGRQLADALRDYTGRPGRLVLGLPRGGVPVAFEVADALDAPLDIFLVRKLGVPGHEELAMGAIASGGVRVMNARVVTELELTEDTVAAVAAAEQRELERRERLYRGDRPAPSLRDRSIVLVDDGLATGASMRAAVGAARGQAARRIVVAVPVAPRDTCEELRREVDEIVCLSTPEPFGGVGLWYADFAPVSDEEIRDLLSRGQSRDEHETSVAR